MPELPVSGDKKAQFFRLRNMPFEPVFSLQVRELEANP